MSLSRSASLQKFLMHKFHFPLSLRLLLFALHSLAWLPAGNAQDTKGAEFFEKQVRPLLAKHCYSCHSTASQPVMAGLKLDTEAGLSEGGSRGKVIVPGEPQRSLLVTAVNYSDDRLRMPPTGKLTDDEIATLTAWVKMGAPWGVKDGALEGDQTISGGKPFWAFQSPREPAIPQVKQRGWVKTPLDAFVLAGLEARGLTPASAADKRTLIRRATFDLTGLPPTPEEVQAFVADDSANAFARLVDRLLASPRYGEKWGRHWLDIARYADSNGLDENLVYKNAYRYRDYVINALNKDKPYNQFILEQLAGDLLSGTSDENMIYERQTATGFLSLGAKMLAEDDPVKMQMDIVDEQIDTVGRAFLAMTVGCARCHDHKFDPIPTADYYSLAGVFKSSKTMENFKVVAKWHEYVLAPKQDRDRLEAHSNRIEAQQKQISRLSKPVDREISDTARRKVGAYLLAATDLLRYESMKLQSVLGDSEKADKSGLLTVGATDFLRGNVDKNFNQDADDPRVLVDTKAAPYFVEYDVVLPEGGSYQLEIRRASPQFHTLDIRINGVLVQAGLPPEVNRTSSPDAQLWTAIGIFPFRQGRNTLRLEIDGPFPYFDQFLVAQNPLPAGAVVPKTSVQVAVDYGINPDILLQWTDYLRRSRGAPASVLYAWHAFGTPAYDSLAAWTSPVARLFDGLKHSTRQELAAFYQTLFDRANSAWRALHPDGSTEDKAEDDNASLKTDKKDETLGDSALEALRQVLYEKFGPCRAPVKSERYYSVETRVEIDRLKKELKALQESTPQFPHAMGVTEGEIGDLPIHIRGSHLTLGDRVPRRFLRVIAGENQTPIESNHSGRLELAQWLTREDHPLTSRVMVNRIWRWHFGRGIVPSTDNFGRLGEPPTNLPLLDWLARRFIQEKWSIKAMHRVMMLSSTYQMSTAWDEKGAEVDPENKLLWRMDRRRLEAEEIRDAIIAVGEGLDLTMGGSMFTFKDREYVTSIKSRDTTDYDANRRSIYLPIIRSSLYDVFQAFDFGDPSVLNGDRQSTVVAPQALFMMNGSLVLKETRKMATNLVMRPELDDQSRVRQAYMQAFGRSPKASEVDRALSFVGRMDAALDGGQLNFEERRLRAWQSLCHTLLASSEFVYVN